MCGSLSINHKKITEISYPDKSIKGLYDEEHRTFYGLIDNEPLIVTFSKKGNSIKAINPSKTKKEFSFGRVKHAVMETLKTSFEYNSIRTETLNYTYEEVKFIFYSEVKQLLESLECFEETTVLHSIANFKSSLDSYGDFRFTDKLIFSPHVYQDYTKEFKELNESIKVNLIPVLKEINNERN